jgi:hypothetical protein
MLQRNSGKSTPNIFATVTVRSSKIRTSVNPHIFHKMLFHSEKDRCVICSIALPSIFYFEKLRVLNVTSNWLYISLAYWMKLYGTSGCSYNNTSADRANSTMAILAELFGVSVISNNLWRPWTLDLTSPIFTSASGSTYDTIYIYIYTHTHTQTTSKPWSTSTKHWKIHSDQGACHALCSVCKHNKSEFVLQRGQSLLTSVLNWQAHRTYQHIVSYICCTSFGSSCIMHDLTCVRTPKPDHFHVCPGF